MAEEPVIEPVEFPRRPDYFNEEITPVASKKSDPYGSDYFSFMPGIAEGNWPMGLVSNDYSQADKDFYKGTQVEDRVNAPKIMPVGREIERQTYKAQVDESTAMPKIPINQEAWDKWLESMPETGQIEDRRGESSVTNAIKFLIDTVKNAPARIAHQIDVHGVAPLKDSSGLPKKLGINQILKAELKT